MFPPAVGPARLPYCLSAGVGGHLRSASPPGLLALYKPPASCTHASSHRLNLAHVCSAVPLTWDFLPVPTQESPLRFSPHFPEPRLALSKVLDRNVTEKTWSLTERLSPWWGAKRAHRCVLSPFGLQRLSAHSEELKQQEQAGGTQGSLRARGRTGSWSLGNGEPKSSPPLQAAQPGHHLLSFPP